MLYIYLMINTNTNINEMKNLAFDIPAVSGGAIARTKQQILSGDERGMRNFNCWVSNSKLTQRQMEVLCAAMNEYFKNK